MSGTSQIRMLASVTARSMATVVALVATLGSQPAIASDATFLPISELDGNEYAPAIAFNSNRDEYLVVWHDVYEVVHARRVSSSGELLNSFEVSTSSNGKRQASVAYDPVRDRYLVAWLYDYYGNASDLDIYGRFIPWDGPSAGLQDFPISNWPSDQSRPVVAYASTADEFLVAWVNEAASVPTYISGRRVFADGSGFPAGDGFTISSGAEDRDFPDLAYNPARNEYLATWQMDTAGGGDIYGVRLSATGTALESGEFAIAGWPDSEELPSVAACETADQYLVAWQSDQGTGGSEWAIYGRFVSGVGVPGNVPLIVDTTAPQTEVDMSCDAAGQQYLLAWEDVYVGGKSGIWARVVHPDETMEPDFVIDQPGGGFDRTAPAVAGGAANYLIAWEQDSGFIPNRNIFGRQVPVPEPASTLATLAAVATLGALFRAKRRGLP